MTIKTGNLFLFVVLCMNIYQFLWPSQQRSIPKSRLLKILYKPYTKPLRNLLTRRWFSMMSGWYCDSPLSSLHIAAFIKKHAIDMSEAQESYFRTFNDFFVRTLKPESRPIDAAHDNTIFVSPADGKIMVYTDLQLDHQFIIKNTPFYLTQFLQRDDLHDYVGGTLIICRLDPWDYHRFHFPTPGIPHDFVSIAGFYESVNPIAYEMIQPLTTNERHIIKFSSLEYDDIFIIPVGAMCVGRIKETYTPYTYVVKGSEMGYFAFGGSTLVIVCKPHTISIDDELIQNSRLGTETFKKMGQKIGIRYENK